MRYDDFRRSDDIEDRRDEGGGGMGGGGGFGIPMGGGGGLGIGTIIVLGLLGYAFGIDPRILIGGAEILTGGEPVAQLSDRSSFRPAQGRRADRRDGQHDLRRARRDRRSLEGNFPGQRPDLYRVRRIVLFRNATNGGRCGMAQSAMGPFYCPPDKTIYLDTAFFREVETRFRGCSGSACKFTAAYIIAHEAGHHIQNLLGILPRVTAAAAAGRQQGGSQRAAGQGRAAGRLPVRRLGQPRGEEASGLPRSRRHRRRAANGDRDRRRHAAAPGDGQGGA